MHEHGGSEALIIRAETPADEEEVRATNEQAFGTAAEAQLVDALRSVAGSISLVATGGSQIVGHILFTPAVVTAAADARVAALAPMAVRPGWQRQGVGSRLIRAGLEACRNAGYTAVVVIGHPEYYPRFGFVPAAPRGLRSEFDVPPEVFMVLELEDGALARFNGLVRYQPAFSAASGPG
jgi:putative acetyltransferase